MLNIDDIQTDRRQALLQITVEPIDSYYTHHQLYHHYLLTLQPVLATVYSTQNQVTVHTVVSYRIISYRIVQVEERVPTAKKGEEVLSF